MAAAKTVKNDSEVARAVEADRVRQAEEHRARNIAFAARMAAVPQSAPAPVPVAKPAGRFVDCARWNCATHLVDTDDVGRDPEVIARHAAVHGHVVVRTPDGDRFFCNALCRDGKSGAAKKPAPAVPLKSPTRVDAPGGVQRCAHPACDARSHIDPTLLPQALAKLAIEGWKETEIGIFCSTGCAKRAQSDMASGFGTRNEIAKHPERGSFAT